MTVPIAALMALALVVLAFVVAFFLEMGRKMVSIVPTLISIMIFSMGMCLIIGVPMLPLSESDVTVLFIIVGITSMGSAICFALTLLEA